MLYKNNEIACLKDYKSTFTSNDLDEARHQISNIFKPHELSVLGKGQSLNAKLGWTDFGDTTFIYLKHGANVNIYAEKLENFFLLQIPLNGEGQLRVDNTVIDISTDMAYVMSASHDLEMRYKKNCEHICLKIEREKLEGFLEQQLQRSLNVPLVFSPKLDLDNSSNRELVDLIIHIAKQLGEEGSSFYHPIVRQQAESLLLSSMLVGLEHNYHEELTAEVQSPRPYYIKKAEAYIHDNIDSPILLEDLAREACISLRSIYSGFHNYLNTTPMAYIKQAKLNRIHEELKKLEPSQASVSEVALNYGFSHFGNFAASYKKMFGELPSDTLRKAVL